MFSHEGKELFRISEKDMKVFRGHCRFFTLRFRRREGAGHPSLELAGPADQKGPGFFDRLNARRHRDFEAGVGEYFIEHLPTLLQNPAATARFIVSELVEPQA